MKSSAKKIVVLTDWYKPGFKAGGPIQSCANFAAAMKNWYEVFVITSDRDLGDSAPYPGVKINEWEQDNGIHVFYCGPNRLNEKYIRELITDVKPDYIYLNHLFSPVFVILPLWLWWREKVSGKMVLAPRGALFTSALHHNGTYLKKYLFISLMKMTGVHRKIKFHATNEREKEAIHKYFPTVEVHVVNNLPQSDQLPFSSVPKQTHTLRLIFIARVLPIKNLLICLRALKEVNSTIHFTIIGPVEDESYWQECRDAISKLPSNITTEHLGAIPNAALGIHLRSHHLFILPSAGENFGHSIFEAFLAGRPVLISDQTPWTNLETKEVGWAIPIADIACFSQRIEEAASWDQEEFDKHAKNAWSFANEFITNSLEVRKYQTLFS